MKPGFWFWFCCITISPPFTLATWLYFLPFISITLLSFTWLSGCMRRDIIIPLIVGVCICLEVEATLASLELAAFPLLPLVFTAVRNQCWAQMARQQSWRVEASRARLQALYSGGPPPLQQHCKDPTKCLHSKSNLQPFQKRILQIKSKMTIQLLCILPLFWQ